MTLPYTAELNDIPTMMIQHHESPYWLTRVRDSFDRLYQESAERPKIMAVAIHPYISGQTHRIRYLEEVYDYVNGHEGVLHWNGAEILGLVARDAARGVEVRGRPSVIPGLATGENPEPTAVHAEGDDRRAQMGWVAGSCCASPRNDGVGVSRQRLRLGRSCCIDLGPG